MPSSRWLESAGAPGAVASQARRALLSAAALAALPRLARAAEVEPLLREGGVVIALRHALAPGTFDPPEFRLGDCSTQRNLSDGGRAQARRIGEWFEARGLTPARVRTSPWCRCVDTAQRAFGPTVARIEPWAALGSPRGATEATNAQSLRALRNAVAEAGRQRGRFEAWVTHMFVLSDLAATGSSPGEGLVLRAAAGGRVEVLARLAPPPA
jgi:Histidine phosphatase superfamily (branch 1)